jgi:lipoprotein NlpD
MLPSRLLRIALVSWLLLAGGCSRQSQLAPVSELSARTSEHRATQHIVTRGDTLGSIAFRYGLGYRRLAAWNRIQPPYTIYPGQRIRLTAPAANRVPRPAGPSRGVIESRPSRPAASKSHRASRKQSSARPPADLRWQWPTRGKLLRRFDPKGVGKKGIDIAGRAGQPIRAAADGKVVYAGSGLKGYGRLIIVKHNKNFLSAYAHNRSLTAREGERVKQGQPIAEMGDSGAKRTMLHFEIRHHGKAVDPLRYLPPRPP